MTARQKVFKIFSVVGLVLLCWTFGYFGNSVNAWFGNVLDPSGYKGLDATSFLENDFAEDASAIRWLKENIKDSPVILEANGDSYTDYERVSAMTGLPTVLGWYVHEWLWRNDTADLNEKSADIEKIYTSTDQSEVEELSEEIQCGVYLRRIYRERKIRRYTERRSPELLRTVVFRDEEYGTYIIKVNK